MIKLIQGSVLDTKEQYVLQQCDCISTVRQKLDADYAKEFSWADVYGDRENMKGWRNLATIGTRGTPGEIKVFDGGSKDETQVIAMFTQMCPGKPFTGLNNKRRFKTDTTDQRLEWFKQCLEKLLPLKPESIAMPNKIGCLNNDGDWEKYSDCIQELSDKLPDCTFYIYTEQ